MLEISGVLGLLLCYGLLLFQSFFTTIVLDYFGIIELTGNYNMFPIMINCAIFDIFIAMVYYFYDNRRQK